MHGGFGSKCESRGLRSVLVMESEVELPTRCPNDCLDSFPSRESRQVGRAPCLYCVSVRDWTDVRGTWTAARGTQLAGTVEAGPGSQSCLGGWNTPRASSWGCTVIPDTPSLALGVPCLAWGCKDPLSFSTRTWRAGCAAPTPPSPALQSCSLVLQDFQIFSNSGM